MTFQKQLAEILGLDHEPHTGAKHCSNCLAFNAISHLIDTELLDEREKWVGFLTTLLVSVPEEGWRNVIETWARAEGLILRDERLRLKGGSDENS